MKQVFYACLLCTAMALASGATVPATQAVADHGTADRCGRVASVAGPSMDGAHRRACPREPGHAARVAVRSLG